MINFFRDRPRTCWFLFGLVIMYLTYNHVWWWVSMAASAIGGCVSALADMRARAVQRRCEREYGDSY